MLQHPSYLHHHLVHHFTALDPIHILLLVGAARVSSRLVVSMMSESKEGAEVCSPLFIVLFLACYLATASGRTIKPSRVSPSSSQRSWMGSRSTSSQWKGVWTNVGGECTLFSLLFSPTCSTMLFVACSSVTLNSKPTTHQFSWSRRQEVSILPFFRVRLSPHVWVKCFLLQNCLLVWSCPPSASVCLFLTYRQSFAKKEECFWTTT